MAITPQYSIQNLKIIELKFKHYIKMICTNQCSQISKKLNLHSMHLSDFITNCTFSRKEKSFLSYFKTVLWYIYVYWCFWIIKFEWLAYFSIRFHTRYNCLEYICIWMHESKFVRFWHPKKNHMKNISYGHY